MISEEICIFVSVRQQVKDISETLQPLLERLGSMQKSMDEMSVTIADLNRTNQAQAVTIAKLQKTIGELTRRLEKYEKPPKDSGNSSSPPSKESLKQEVIRRTRSLRKKSDKKAGGQPGHEGRTLEVSDEVDFIEEHQPDYCAKCGASLEGMGRILEYTTQELDVPLAGVRLTEHRHYSRVCSCGHHNPVGVKRGRGGNKVTYGKNIRAIIVYLSVVQCIPYERLQSMLAQMFQLHMSQGTIRNILQEANRKARPAIELIKKAIMSSPVVGFDESGCYCSGRLDWSWIAQTVYHTLVFRSSGRAGKELEKVFGDSLKNMVVVTDRHSAYFALEFLGHQVCLAHLLRELEYLGELDKGQKWSARVKTLLQEAIKERNENPDRVIDKAPWLQRFDRLLQQSVANLKEEFQRMKNGLQKCRDFIFNFLDNPAIPPTNNDSERGIRKLKVKQKISGTFRSEDGADVFHRIHSIVDTARKNNQPQLEAIIAVLGCQA